jgi:hypothetical protein
MNSFNPTQALISLAILITFVSVCTHVFNSFDACKYVCVNCNYAFKYVCVKCIRACK